MPPVLSCLLPAGGGGDQSEGQDPGDEEDHPVAIWPLDENLWTQESEKGTLGKVFGDGLPVHPVR